MEIVKASLQDSQGLVSLSKVLGYEVDEAGVSKRLEKIISREDHCLLVAKEDEKLIGFCHGYVRTLVEVDEAVEIGGLAVVEEYRGQKIGRKLTEGIEDWARDNGFSQVVLSSNVIRENAHQFYQHLDYKIIKKQFALEKLLD